MCVLAGSGVFGFSEFGDWAPPLRLRPAVDVCTLWPRFNFYAALVKRYLDSGRIVVYFTVARNSSTPPPPSHRAVGSELVRQS